MGYEIVGLRSSWTATEWIDADRYLGPDPVDIDSLQEPFQFNAFEGMLLQSSVGLILTDLGGDKIANWTRGRNTQPFDVLREIILSEFDTLPEVAASPGPKFVFAHIVAPHAPYLFGPNGEASGQSEAFTLAEPTRTGSSNPILRYRDQAIFITAKIQTAIDGILVNSAVPPIIILQADHGSGATPRNRGTSGEEVRQRMSILNAYRLPDTCQSQLYPTLSPINSFRLLFNCVYGADYPLLADDTFYSPWPYESDYSFTLVNDLLQ